jgi:hypothetical protein
VVNGACADTVPVVQARARIAMARYFMVVSSSSKTKGCDEGEAEAKGGEVGHCHFLFFLAASTSSIVILPASKWLDITKDD